MKLAFATACVLVFGLPAFADAPRAEKPHYTKTGQLCTPEQVANPPMVAITTARGRTYKSRMVCLTKSEWTIERSAAADKQRYAEREREQMFANLDGRTDNPGLLSN